MDFYNVLRDDVIFGGLTKIPNENGILRVLFVYENKQHTILLRFPKIIHVIEKIENECGRGRFKTIKSLCDARTIKKFTKENVSMILHTIKHGVLVRDKGTNELVCKMCHDDHIHYQPV